MTERKKKKKKKEKNENPRRGERKKISVCEFLLAGTSTTEGTKLEKKLFLVSEKR